MLLITTTGAKSGKLRTNPLVSHTEEGRLFVMAYQGGAPENPDWYHNLKANPGLKVELGAEAFEATAAEVSEPERSEIFAWVGAVMPNFLEVREEHGSHHPPGRAAPLLTRRRRVSRRGRSRRSSG